MTSSAGAFRRTLSSPTRAKSAATREVSQFATTRWKYIRDGHSAEKVIKNLLDETERAGDQRDAVGATPLCLAVLYSKSTNNKPPDDRRTKAHRSLGWEEKEEHEAIAKQIWDHPQMKHLRTLAYDRTDYEGETAIHLAIAKRRGDLACYFLDRASDDERKILLEERRAVGTFYFAHFKTSDGHKRCKFGEHPVCWAACSNQEKLVDRLVTYGASLDCKTHFGDSILHMLVRWSGWLEDTDREKEAVVADGSRGASNSEWLIRMFDSIEGKMLDRLIKDLKLRKPVPLEEQQHLIRTKIYTRNNDNLTPLLLAACGKNATTGPHRKMFNHLLKKHVQSMWIFGPFRGITMDVSEIDPVVVVARAQKAAQQRQNEVGELAQEEGESATKNPTVLSILVQEQNTDLICNKYIQALLDTKWDKYIKEVRREGRVGSPSLSLSLSVSLSVSVSVSVSLSLCLYLSHAHLPLHAHCRAQELLHRILQTILMILCLVEAQLIPVSDSNKLMKGFRLEWVFEPMMTTKNLMFLYFFARNCIFLFAGDVDEEHDFTQSGLQRLWFLFLIFEFPVLYIYDTFIIPATPGLLVMTAFSALVVSVIGYTFNCSAFLFDQTWGDCSGPQTHLGIRPRYLHGRLRVEKLWIVGTFFANVLLAFLEHCFAAYTLPSAVWGQLLPLEFSLWQASIYLHIIPWAIVMARSPSDAKRAKVCCIVVVLLSYIFSAMFSFKCIVGEYVVLDWANAALNRMFADQILQYECGRSTLDSETVESILIQLASVRTKIAVWGFLLLGTGFIFLVELRELHQKVSGLKGRWSRYIKVFLEQYLRTESRLGMMQNFSSFLLFPSICIMTTLHLLDWYMEVEFFFSILLTAFLVLRFMIYLLGIEPAAQNLLMLYEARKDFLVVFIFYLVLHYCVSMMLALNSRFRFERPGPATSSFDRAWSNCTWNESDSHNGTPGADSCNVSAVNGDAHSPSHSHVHKAKVDAVVIFAWHLSKGLRSMLGTSLVLYFLPLL